ncbi:MAG: hypothetical protein WCJ81_01185 [bacterium]
MLYASISSQDVISDRRVFNSDCNSKNFGLFSTIVKYLSLMSSTTFSSNVFAVSMALMHKGLGIYLDNFVCNHPNPFLTNSPLVGSKVNLSNPLPASDRIFLTLTTPPWHHLLIQSGSHDKSKSLSSTTSLRNTPSISILIC